MFYWAVLVLELRHCYDITCFVKCAGCYAFHLLKHPCEMGLIGKPKLMGDLG
jgi:hypothetical protein